MLSLLISGEDPDLEANYKHILISEDNICCLKGVLFLGTPFEGSAKANFVTPFINALSTINPLPMGVNLVKELSSIPDGTGDLKDISQRANIVMTRYKIKVLVAYETQPMTGTGRRPVSAILPCLIVRPEVLTIVGYRTRIGDWSI